jgi:hypothetical protein
MFSLPPFFKGVIIVGVGLFLLWQAVSSVNLNRRLDANPHVQGKVERTWTSTGKSASRYADVSFPGPIGIGLCHAKGVRLGGSGVFAAVGQSLDLAPLPGSCDNPDAATARASPFIIAACFAIAFSAILYGVLMTLGIVPASRAGGFARAGP